MRRVLVIAIVTAVAALGLAPSASAWDSGNVDGTQPVLALDDNGTCAIREGDTIYCWGNNTYGELGRGSTDPAATVLPVATPYNFTARSISGSAFVRCAVLFTSGVACWGYSSVGSIGNGSTSPAYTPTAVTGLTGVTGVSVGPSASVCATKQDGTVWCWGSGHGNVLSSASPANSSVPVQRAGVSAAIDVSVGNNYACALTASHKVLCWGDNGFGQLGDGTQSDNPTPTAVPGISDALAISAGLYTTCAIRTGGTVWCWGSNDSGALGIHSTVDHTASPTQVWGISGAVAVSESAYGGCALLSSGTVKCWGSGNFGRLGDEQGTPQFSPVTATSALAKTTAIATSLGHSCTIASGRIWCWGANTSGKLGDGTTNAALAGTGPGNAFGYAASPTKVPVLNSAPGKPVAKSTVKGRATLTWSAPSTSNGTSVPTDYTIQYRLKGTSTWKTFKDAVSSSRSATVTGLTSGKYYEYRVLPRNWAGTGTTSATASAVKTK